MKSLRNLLLILFTTYLVSCSQHTESSPTFAFKPGSPTSTSQGVETTGTEKTEVLSTTTTIPPQKRLTPTFLATETLQYEIPIGTEKTITLTPTLTPTTANILPLTKLVFIRPNTDIDNIPIINLEGEILSTVAQGVFWPVSVSWSPDGHWIAFTDSFGRLEPSEIYVVNADGSHLKRITYPPHDKDYVSWSPDGKYLVYTEQGESSDIVILNLKTLKTSKITYTDGFEFFPTWSSDGKHIAFIYSQNIPALDISLWVIDADGQNRKQVIDYPASFSPISLSPNGSQIAFASDKDDFGSIYESCADIYRVNVDGSDLQQITNVQGCARHPIWSPDGKHIAYLSSLEKYGDVRSMGWQIHIMDPDGSNDVAITPLEWNPQYFSWSPVPILEIGKTYHLTQSGANLNLRQEPTLSSRVLRHISASEDLLVLEGPVDQDDYYWWRLRTQDGIEGWVMESFGWFKDNE